MASIGLTNNPQRGSMIYSLFKKAICSLQQPQASPHPPRNHPQKGSSMLSMTDEERRGEIQKRQPVFTKSPLVVLVKFYEKPLPGLREAGRDNATIKLHRVIEARMRNLDPHVYDEGDGRKDTGFQKYRNEKNVRVYHLVDHLLINGYRYIDGHWQEAGKGPVNTLCFVQGAEKGKVIPHEIVRLIRTRKYTLDLWCNMRTNDAGSVYRLDTINLKHANIWQVSQSYFDLRVDGNTYDLVKH